MKTTSLAFFGILAACIVMSCDKMSSELEYEKYPYSKSDMNARIEKYLDGDYPSSVTSVTVSETEVTITGTCSGEGKFCIAEIAPNEDVTEYTLFRNKYDISSGAFNIVLPRRVERIKVNYDRVLSKWAIVRETSDGDELVSHARYADEVACVRNVGKGVLKNKKGLGAGGSNSSYFSDISELGVSSITANIDIGNLLSSRNTTGAGMAFMFNGIEYYINTEYLQSLDDRFQTAESKGLIVSAIILAPTSSDDFKDPECDGGYYSMPNLTTARAVNTYAAVLDFLAERYTSGQYGRIHHWIMHNEVDDNRTWTNMGNQPAARFYDRYMKSMRICYNTVRQYDRNASVLASFTHSWFQAPDGYDSGFAPLALLERNVKYSAAEGDFRWGVAYHPYPVNLKEPRFWDTLSEDYSQATYTAKSKYVTFRNPEVINAWIMDRKHWYKGNEKRVLFFSEQGTNSPTYDEADLAYQAAGAAWLWKKCEVLEGIDAVQWHAWCDNKDEFGLKIGLRDYDFNVKPVFNVWKAAGTASESSLFEPYLGIVGAASWESIIADVQ